MVSDYGAYDLFGNSGIFFWGAFCRLYIGLLLFLERGVEHGRVEILMIDSLRTKCYKNLCNVIKFCAK